MKLKSLLAIALITVLFNSCLKEHNSEDVLKDKGSVISKIQEVGQYGFVKAISLNVTPSTETLDLITLQVWAPRDNKPSGKVHLKLTLDSNAVISQGLKNLPASAYSGLVLEYDVAAGESVSVPITINKNNLNLSYTYGIGFILQTASQGVISEIDKEIVVQIGLKNAYDGIYKTRGYTLRAGDPVLTGNFSNVEIGLVTAGVYVNDFDRPQVWGDGQTGVAIGNPRITVDPATNNVTITSSGGAMNYPGYPSRYDPATKTFYLGFTWGAGPTARAAFDTMVYNRPR